MVMFVKKFDNDYFYLYMRTSIYGRRPDKIANILRRKGYNVRIDKSKKYYLIYIKKRKKWESSG